ncbi:hypothetical protein CPARA_1gp068 (nucleomorph) [Cryptomonas paramecium]|uniref:Uncharacterized protein n=1 Tax=Cryptomonas paramaecium TaxID=2898 RepID=F2HHD0_9CRYP|nr:hypothetical protein CPARA_1gp068 [Cryptomonas paramecium]AEA38726.1 hypothetical protein CPARA_1gp068 [Cryptomonas paramecium]|mmetsp:Transcript_39311/g.104184  ORF Transcript_39311/g.104184 Transcript_39311/m.104184 type:complete len:137 (-) Transcript_39311:4228-4638(-)
MSDDVHLLFLKCIHEANLCCNFNILYINFRRTKKNTKKCLYYNRVRNIKFSSSRIFVSNCDNTNQKNMLIQLNYFLKKKISYHVIKVICKKTYLRKYMILINSDISESFFLDISSIIFLIKKIYFSKKSIFLRTFL